MVRFYLDDLKRVGNLLLVFLLIKVGCMRNTEMYIFYKIGQLGNIWRGGSQPPHIKQYVNLRYAAVDEKT